MSINMNAVQLYKKVHGKDITKGRVYAYWRFSSTKQLGNTSEDRQTESLDDMQRTITELLDIESGEVFSDKALSAYSDRKSNLDTPSSEINTFLTMVDEGEVPRGSILIAEAASRLSRKGWDKGDELLARLSASGVYVVLGSSDNIFGLCDPKAKADEHSYFSTVIQGFIWGALFKAAQLESLEKSNRSRGALKAQQDLIMQGEKLKYNAGCPHWLAFDGKKFVDGKYARFVRTFIEHVVAGDNLKESCRKAIKICGKANSYELSGVHTFAQHASLDGTITFHRIYWDSEEGAFLPEENLTHVADYFPSMFKNDKQRKTYYERLATAQKSRKQSNTAFYMARELDHLFICGECGAPMRNVSKGIDKATGKIKRFQMVCSHNCGLGDKTYLDARGNERTYATIDSRIIEHKIYDYVAKNKRAFNSQPTDALDKSITDIDKMLAAIDKKKAKLNVKFDNDMISVEEFGKDAKDLKTQTTNLTDQRILLSEQREAIKGKKSQPRLKYSADIYDVEDRELLLRYLRKTFSKISVKHYHQGTAGYRGKVMLTDLQGSVREIELPDVKVTEYLQANQLHWDYRQSR